MVMAFAEGQRVTVVRGGQHSATVMKVRPSQVLVQFDSGDSAWVSAIQVRARGLPLLRAGGRSSPPASASVGEKPARRASISSAPGSASGQAPNLYAAPRSSSPSSGDAGWKHLLFSFDGRIGRASYWMGYLVMMAVPVIVGVLAGLSAGVRQAMGPAAVEPNRVTQPASGAVSGGALLAIAVLIFVVMIPFWWASLALSVKRWHDRDKSGYWVLLNFVPYLGALWTFIECGCMRGTQGPNRYGPDPLD